MEHSARYYFAALLLLVFIAESLAKTSSCGSNEVSNPTGECRHTCNACKECGPCLCKPGYIRAFQGKECLSEVDCHTLHVKWIHAAKHMDQRDKFFNCTQ